MVQKNDPASNQGQYANQLLSERSIWLRALRQASASLVQRFHDLDGSQLLRDAVLQMRDGKVRVVRVNVPGGYDVWPEGATGAYRVRLVPQLPSTDSPLEWPSCSCDADFMRDGFCVHLVCALLYDETQRALTPVVKTVNQTRPQDDQDFDNHGTLPFSNASIKWVEQGVEILMTLRDNNDQRLYQRLSVLLRRAKKAIRTPPPTRQPPPAEGQLGVNGQTSRPQDQNYGSNPDQDQGWCRVHHIWMTRREGRYGVWYEHQTDDGSVCKGVTQGRRRVVRRNQS